MSTPDATKSVQQIIMSWWAREIASDRPSAASLSARLRRAKSPSDALAEPAVHDLVDAVMAVQGKDSPAGRAISTPEILFRLVTVLAHVKTSTTDPLFRILGKGGSKGKSPSLSHLRFKKILSSTEQDLATVLRRAVQMADGKANVGRLAGDMLFFGEKTRQTWCFDYFQSPAPLSVTPNSKETSV